MPVSEAAQATCTETRGRDQGETRQPHPRTCPVAAAPARGSSISATPLRAARGLLQHRTPRSPELGLAEGERSWVPSALGPAEPRPSWRAHLAGRALGLGQGGAPGPHPAGDRGRGTRTGGVLRVPSRALQGGE